MSNFDYKSFSLSELKECFSSFKFKIEPRWHQYVSMAFAIDKDRVGFFHDVGTGKTFLSLTVAQLWEANKIFVVCPTSALNSWEREIKRSTDYTTCFLTHLTTKQRKKEINSNSKNIFICHYEGLKTLFAEFKPFFKWTCPYCEKVSYSLTEENILFCKYCKRAINSLECDFEIKKKWVLDNNKLQYWDCLILDEIHKCSCFSSLQTNICREMSKRSKHVLGLTGTPIDRSLLELFEIMYIIDLGKSLGTKFFLFRNYFFYKSGYEWLPKAGSREKILNTIKKSVISFSAEECWDLPDLIEGKRLLNSTPCLKRMQEQLRNEYELTINQKTYKIETDHKRLELLRQLCCGFLYLDDDVIFLQDCPKLDALINIIQESKKKVIVFYHYKQDQVIIENGLKKFDIKYISMYGGQDSKERKKAEILFATKDEIKVLVVQHTVGCEGFDGSASSIVVFWTPVGSPRIRKQCHGRIQRPTQKQKKLFSIDLVIKNSIEELIILHRSERFNFVKDCMCFLRKIENEHKVNSIA